MGQRRQPLIFFFALARTREVNARLNYSGQRFSSPLNVPITLHKDGEAMPNKKQQHRISDETKKRCQVFPITKENSKRFTPISLELFHYLFELTTIDFSIYFQVQDQMVEYIKPSEFSHELLQTLITSRNKKLDNLEICLEKREYPLFQAAINSVRESKIKRLIAKDPSLDINTINVFSDLSNASQMVIRGGINRQVALEVQSSASRLVNHQLDSLVTIGTLSRMVLADPTLYDHSASVAMIAAMIAKSMLKKSRDITQQIALSGLYHDVGKTCVPYHILNKPGKFTPDEFEVMKGHATLGYKELQIAIKQGAPITPEVTLIALEHHEKFCGHGYPHGKVGRREEREDGIHEYSRIVSIADVYSALLMKRVYKEAYDPQRALTIMAKVADKDYDPLIFQPFLKEVVQSLRFFENLKQGPKTSKGRVIVKQEGNRYPRAKKTS